MLQKEIKIKTDKKFIDITEKAKKLTDASGVKSGLLNIYSLHTTLGIAIMENEILSKLDICKYLEKLAPDDGSYDHDRIDLRQVPPDERVNGHSHIWKLSFPSSENVPITGGKLRLGEWQSILLVELDWQEPFRERTVIFTCMGGEE